MRRPCGLLIEDFKVYKKTLWPSKRRPWSLPQGNLVVFPKNLFSSFLRIPCGRPLEALVAFLSTIFYFQKKWKKNIFFSHPHFPMLSQGLLYIESLLLWIVCLFKTLFCFFFPWNENPRLLKRNSEKNTFETISKIITYNYQSIITIIFINLVPFHHLSII